MRIHGSLSCAGSRFPSESASIFFFIQGTKGNCSLPSFGSFLPRKSSFTRTFPKCVDMQIFLLIWYRAGVRIFDSRTLEGVFFNFTLSIFSCLLAEGFLIFSRSRNHRYFLNLFWTIYVYRRRWNHELLVTFLLKILVIILFSFLPN